MNHAIIIGNLTKEPVLEYVGQNQTPRTYFTVAVNRPKKDGQDNGADYIRVVTWAKLAENCDRYLAKGRKVAVSGSIQTGSYQNRDGVTVYTTDLKADHVEFLSSGKVNDTKTWEPEDTFAASDDDVPW